MDKKNLYTLITVFILAIFCGFLVYPQAWNKGVDFINPKISFAGFKIPHYFNIPFKLGLDLQGGTHLLYQADLSQIQTVDYNSSMQGLRDVIERRVNLFGVREPVVQVEQNTHRLSVDLAGVKDVNQAIQMIGQTPFLQFEEPKENYQAILDNNQKVVESATGTLENPFQVTTLTGQYLQKADVVFDQTTYKPQISLQFNDEGAKIFEDLTGKNVGKPLAIFIDDVLLSAPVVQEKISGGKAQITGNFTADEAKKLAQNLNAGALPVPIKLISQQTVGPTLGTDSLSASLKAGLIGFLAIILFMIIFYRLPGLLASIALLLYVAFVLALFKPLVTLSLAGIAGFILSIGMAVDANVLIFARMREELSWGKTFNLAVEEGFKRAWPSIRDGNLTTLVVAVFMFFYGTSFVKGFALTLSIGVLVSMFSAITVTKGLLKLFIGTKLEKIKQLWR